MNDFGDSLYYNGEYYTLITNDITAYLGNWFCKWKSNKGEEMKEFEHIDLLELALRVCGYNFSKKIITLILKLNNLPLKSATLKDILEVQSNNEKLYETK